MKKKILSMLIASSMLSATGLPMVNAEELPQVEYEATDFERIEIREDKLDFKNRPENIRYGNVNGANATYGNAKLYKLSNVLGMDEGEYGIEMISREQRADKSHFMFGKTNTDYSTAEDFYITTNLYLGDQRNNDYFRIGGEYNDGSSRVTQYIWLQGNGRVAGNNRNQDDLYGAAYVPNNWYNVTIAYDADTKNTTLYVDGKEFIDAKFDSTTVTPHTVTTGINSINLGIRMEQRAGSEAGGLPSWAIMKNAAIVPGEYVPADTDTTISSEIYEIGATSLYIENGATADKAQAYVGNVDAATTVPDFLAGITVPEGASKSVIKIDGYSKATVAVSEADTMTDDMVLLVKAADGSMKLYDVQLNENSLPKITSSLGRYVVDEENKTLTMPDTRVDFFTRYVTGTDGTVIKVVTAEGDEVTTGLVRKGMKIIAEKNGAKAVYDIVISNNYAFDTRTTLKNYEDDTVLLAATLNYNSETGAIDQTLTTNVTNTKLENSRLAGFHNAGGKGSNITPQLGGASAENDLNVPYSVKKVSMSDGTPAWKFESGFSKWIQHATGTELYKSTMSEKGSKTIINYKVNMTSGAMCELFTSQATNTSGSGTTFNGTGSDEAQTSKIGFRLAFKYGAVYFGRTAYHSGNYIEIGKYSNDTEYDVTIIQKTPNGEKELVIEGIYLNGKKIFPLENHTTTTDGYFHITGSTALYSAARSISIGNHGTVIMGGLNTYMADAYNYLDEEETADAANLTITPIDGSGIEVYTSDSLADGMATIKGYTGTVGELRSSIDSDINTRIKVLDRTGSAELNDNADVETDMLLCVVDVNDYTNVAYYVLSDIINMGEFSAVKGENITVTRTVKAYKTENENVSLFVASYDTNGRLVSVDVDTKSVTEPGSYVFEASVPAGATETKAMLWENMTPYCDDTIIQ